MLLRLFNLFFLLFVVLKVSANPNLPGPAPQASNPAVAPAFVPNFSGEALSLSQGTKVNPLCNPLDPSCIYQWSQQAVPLSVQRGLGAGPGQFQYFLPVFIPSRVVAEDPTKSDEWMSYTPSYRSYSRGSRKGSRKTRRSRRKADQAIDEKLKKDDDSKKKKDEVVKGKKAKEPPQPDTTASDSVIALPETEHQAPDRYGKTSDSIPDPEEASPIEQPAAQGPQTKTKAEDVEVSDPAQSNTGYYISKKDPSKIRLVTELSNGDQVITEGQVAFVPSEDLKQVFSGTRGASPKVTKKDTPPDTKVDAPRVDSVSKPSPSGQALNQDQSVTSATRREDIPLPKRRVKPVQKVSLPVFETTKDTVALSATTKEVKPGCFVIKKKEEVKTEAGFCFHCPGKGEDSLLFELAQHRKFVSQLGKELRKVSFLVGEKFKGKRIKLNSGKNESIQKICSPEKTLKSIINNFEETCCPSSEKICRNGKTKCLKKNKICPKPYNKFSKFFNKYYCKSCEKGVSFEIWMAMQSIESAGRCDAVGTIGKNEQSSGLGQVDSNQHSCKDLVTGKTYKKGTSANRKCLKNKDNNFNTSIGILLEHYGLVNPKPISTSQCKPWLEMKPEERNSWRRGVSSYNGGNKWVKRAIYSYLDKRILDKSFLIRIAEDKNLKLKIQFWKQLKEKYKKTQIPWEKLRAYYLVEKLSQGVVSVDAQCKKRRERGSGRLIGCTLSNLAHTEAVLGREVKGSTLGMVEIWSQYVRKHKPSCPKKKQ